MATVEELVTSCLTLVHHIVRRHGYSPLEYDDAVGYGYVGLMKAANNYDVGRGDFIAYAYYRIRGEITDERRRILGRNFKKIAPFSLNSLLEGKTLDVEDFNPEEPQFDEPLPASLLATLTTHQRAIIEAVYRDGKNFSKIARENGISRSAVSSSHNMAIIRMRAMKSALSKLR